MKSKTILGIVVAVLIVIAGIIILSQNGSEALPPSSLADSSTAVSTPTNDTPTASPEKPLVKSYSLAEVALHGTPASCWTAVDGSVYDVTPWISEHPGGAARIISMCGIDASAAYNGQHGGQKRPANELAGFRIGALIK